MSRTLLAENAWWRGAVVYQVYVRSFRDGSGDGIGDLRGLRDGLDYLRELGVDALWLNPCYASPQRDHGYDISDYFEIDPSYGTNADLVALIEDAHARGMRLLMDMVANHCSTEHEWFRAALAAGKGSPERERFLFRDGRGTRGELPPNNWQSVFGGSAWTRVRDPDGSDGQWYFHAFDPGQPDFNWRNPEVGDYFRRVLRHWFDLGVDGFRIDVAHGLFKSAEMADWPGEGHNHEMWDQPEVHEVYRSWRALADSYPAPKFFVGEIWVPTPDSLSAYLRTDELHQAFAFDLLVQPWDAARMREAIETGMRQVALSEEPPAWVLANHDVHRAVSRYGQEQMLERPPLNDMIAAARRIGVVDLPLGQRRAKAAVALLLALPGTAYIYQGEELGLPEVYDLPPEARQDPIWIRSKGAELGRDGCRVPLPWRHAEPAFGFSGGRDVRPWLPQPAWFGQFAADRQGGSGSVLQTYRELISARRVFEGDDLVWLDGAPDGVLAFVRGGGVCVVNFSRQPARLPVDWPVGERIAVTAHDSEDGTLAPDSAAWFALADSPAAHEAGDSEGAHGSSPASQPHATTR